jgi:hypothetical protein
MRRSDFPAVRPLVRRWWFVTSVIAIVVVAWGVSLSFAGDRGSPPVTREPVATSAAPPPATPQVPATVPASPGVLATDQGWNLLSYSISPDSLGYFAATITVTNSSASPRPGLFTLTVMRADKVIATLRGFASSTPAHRNVSVPLISLDHYAPGSYTVKFRSYYS